MVDGTHIILAVDYLRMVARRVFPDRVFGKALTTAASLKTGQRSEFGTNHLNEFLDNVFRITGPRPLSARRNPTGT